jgi:hypothetical protein
MPTSSIADACSKPCIEAASAPRAAASPNPFAGDGAPALASTVHLFLIKAGGISTAPTWTSTWGKNQLELLSTTRLAEILYHFFVWRGYASRENMQTFRRCLQGIPECSKNLHAQAYTSSSRSQTTLVLLRAASLSLEARAYITS